LSLAICNSPALREYLIGKVTEQKAGIEIIQVEKNCTNLLAAAEEKLASRKPPAVFVTEIENALPSDDIQPKVIGNLNASRELWQERFSCPVVFWLPEYAATMLQRDALDFASWISHIFEFVSEQATAMAGTVDAYAGDIMSAGRLDADQKRFRIAELEQRIEDAGDTPKPKLSRHVLTWLSELAYIYQAIGDLDKAEENILRSLKMAEKFELQEVTSRDYCNLGIIYQTRGDLDKAEQMHTRALEIDEKLGWIEGIATQYSNLGLIHIIRGDLDKAEQMISKALEIDEKLGRLDRTANHYAKLGVIYGRRNELDGAEEMFHKAVGIDSKLGRLDGLASAYGSLGVISQTRGDLDKAEQMYNKSLCIHEKLGQAGGVADQCGNLGTIYLMRGNLDKAEQMFRKSLEINEKPGRSEGMANQYGNLGLTYRSRGEVEKAREYWERALGLYERIGMRPEIEKVQRWIDELKEA